MAIAKTNRSARRKRRQPKAGWAEACAEMLGKVAALLGGKTAAQSSSAATQAEPRKPLLDLKPAPQLTKLSGVVETAAGHGERASHYHERAGLRVDAALYELEQLRKELESVVDPQLLARTMAILEQSAALKQVAAVSRADSADSTARRDEPTVAPARAARPAA